MANLVIVALPREDDYVNKISSEEVAHMTLLSLGDVKQVKNLSSILGFVEHAANQSLMRFSLEVDHRGELGEDNADVLFFSKSKWSGFPSINTFRNYLLQEPNIRTLYDSNDQFDEWNPHLTLGYPDTPANPDNRDYPISYVEFDRIAVWFAEYEGLEFRLKNYEWDSDVMAQGEEFVLEHFGVKGMRWGHRKENVHPDIADIPKKTRKEASDDAEEFTRAKLYFGEGAGNRRKLIKATVETKKKKDPLYARAFDHFVKMTDLAQRADQARKQRKRTDRTKSTKKVAKRVGRLVGTPEITSILQNLDKNLAVSRQNEYRRMNPHSNIHRRGY